MALESQIIPVIDIGVISLVAILFGILFTRMKLSSAVGYILAGVFLGPMALGMLVPGQGITPVFAEFGVLLIMFYLGLELNVRKFKETGALSFVLAISQMAVVFAGGFLAGKIFGFADMEAVIIGAMLVCTSTVMVAKFLIEKNIIGNTDSRIALSVLILQDLFAIFTLVLISSFSTEQSFNSLVLTAVLFMIAVFFAVSKASRTLLNWLHSIGQDNKMVFYAIGIGVVFSALAKEVGLSPVIGAFFAGLALAETKYGDRIKNELGLFREFFVLFFFVAFGTTVFYNAEIGAVVLPTIAEFLPILGMSLALVAIYIIGSLIAFTISGLAMGLDKYTMSNVTMLLIPLGEFVIIIAAAGQPLFSAAAYMQVSAIAFLLILITAPLSPIMYGQSRKIIDFIFTLLPKQTQSVLNSIGSNAKAAEKLVNNPAFKNEIFEHVERVLENAVIILAITYISVLLKEQFVSVDVPLPLLPGLTLSAAVLALIIWPAYKLVANLRALFRDLFKEFTLNAFPMNKQGRKLESHVVDVLTALLLTAGGVVAFAWSYYSVQVDATYLVFPAIYTLLAFAYLSTALHKLLQGFSSIATPMKGTVQSFTREFNQHSRHLAALNSKRIEAKEKAEEAIEAGNLKRARRIIYDYHRFEYKTMHNIGFNKPPARKSLEKYFLNKKPKKKVMKKTKRKKSRGKK